MASGGLIDQLQQRFNCQFTAELTNEIASQCRVYDLDANEYFIQWEAYVIQHTVGNKEPQLTLESVRELRKELSKRLSKITGEAEAKPAGGAVKKSGRTGMHMALDDLGFSAPSSSKIRLPTNTSGGALAGRSAPRLVGGSLPLSSREPQVAPAKPVPNVPGGQSTDESKPVISGNTDAAFLARIDALETLESLNAHLSMPSPALPVDSNTSRVALSSTADPKAYNYRYMFEKLSDRSEVLDQRIEEAAELLKEWYGVPEWGDPSLMSQEECWAVGRVCAENEGAKLTEAACWLEPSRMGGGGRRTWLKWSSDVCVRGVGAGAGGVGLFPGSLVGIRGKNGGGGYFTVEEVITMPPVEPPLSYPGSLLQLQHSPSNLNGAPSSLMVACGPYTTDDSLEYLPFEAFVDQLVKERPDVVLLVGPFLDANHPLIKSGDIDAFPAQIFRHQISARLERFIASCPWTSIILVPSLRDLISHHLAFPQSPFVRDPELGLPRRCKLLPNPANFQINEVALGVTSVDVLMAIRGGEWFRSAREHEDENVEGQEKDPGLKEVIPRAVRHMMRQRSYYPVFPPTTAPHLDPVNLDITHHHLLSFGPVGVDILILPSALTPFAKVIDSTVVINPGSLAKGKKTFAKVSVSPHDKKELEKALSATMEVEGEAESGEPVDHRVYERCRVELLKI